MSTPFSYEIQTTLRDGGGQVPEDWHATVKRVADGVELIFISKYHWILMRKLRQKKIDKAFAKYDKEQARIREGSRTLHR